MTIIAALRDGDTIYMGADSWISDGENGEGTRSSTPKVWKKDELCFGATGSARTIDLLCRQLTITCARRAPDAFDFLSVNVATAIRMLLAEHGQLKNDDGIEQMNDTALVIGCRGRLFEMDNEFAVWESHADYVAIGAAQDLALGSLHTSAQSTMTPPQRIKAALEASEEFCSQIRGPFTLLGPV